MERLMMTWAPPLWAAVTVGPQSSQMSSQMLSPTGTPEIVQHGDAIAGCEVALLVEDGVVGQKKLAVVADHRSPDQNSRSVEDVSSVR